MINRSFVLILFFTLFLSTVGKAEVLRYVDRNGKLHYVDHQSKVPPEYRGQAGEAKPLPKISKQKSIIDLPTSVSRGRYGCSKRVEIFVTTWCPVCKNLERYLDKKRIRYVRYDIDKSAKGRKAYKQMGGSAVPMIRVGTQIIRGFDQQALQAALHRC